MGSPRRLRLLRALLRNALLLLLCFVVLEVGTRLLVAHRGDLASVVTDLDPEHRNAFRPNREHVYETQELQFTVKTNRFGRRDVEWPAAVIADPQNILFLGDSMVFGYGVDHESTVTTLLETRFGADGRPREVFSFSSVGCGLPAYAEMFDEALQVGVAAETVVLGITVGNDFSEDVLLPAPLPAAEETKPAAPRWQWNSEFLAFLKRRAIRSPLVIGSTLTIGRWLGMSLYDTSGSYIFLRNQTADQVNKFGSVLRVSDRIVATARAHGRRLYVVIFPNKIQVENRHELTGAIYDAEKPNRLIIEKCDSLGVPCLDLLPVLSGAYEAGSGPLFFPIDRHHNEKGNAIAADAIFRFLSTADSRVDPPGHGA
jgi:hypothetical protein